MTNIICHVTMLQKSSNPGHVRINMKAASDAAFADCFCDVEFSAGGADIAAAMRLSSRTALTAAGDPLANSRKVMFLNQPGVLS